MKKLHFINKIKSRTELETELNLLKLKSNEVSDKIQKLDTHISIELNKLLRPTHDELRAQVYADNKKCYGYNFLSFNPQLMTINIDYSTGMDRWDYSSYSIR